MQEAGALFRRLGDEHVLPAADHPHFQHCFRILRILMVFGRHFIGRN